MSHFSSLYGALEWPYERKKKPRVLYRGNDMLNRGLDLLNRANELIISLPRINYIVSSNYLFRSLYRSLVIITSFPRNNHIVPTDYLATSVCVTAVTGDQPGRREQDCGASHVLNRVSLELINGRIQSFKIKESRLFQSSTCLLVCCILIVLIKSRACLNHVYVSISECYAASCPQPLARAS